MSKNKGYKVKHISGQGGGGCFAEGTLVLTPDGERPIQDIGVGDYVMAWSLPNGDLEPREVVDVYHHDVVHDTFDTWMHIIHEKGELFVTDNHHILNEQGTWTDARDLDVGDVLILADGTPSVIKFVEHEDNLDWDDLSDNFMDGFDTDFSFNLLVDDLHTYVANGVKVSNGGGSKDSPEQHTPQEAPNTLQSKQLVRIIDMLGEGEIEGFAYPPGHTLDGDTITLAGRISEGIFIDNTPLQTEGGTENFGGINIYFRDGSPYPTQKPIPGFEPQKTSLA